MGFLEIQWDYNWFKDQKVTYHVRIKVKAVKVFKDSLIRWLLPLRPAETVISGKILSSSIELEDEELGVNDKETDCLQYLFPIS